MKVLSRLAIAMAICLMVVPIMASPVEAAGSFRVSGGTVGSDGGYVGDEIRVYGSWAGSHGSYMYVYYELFGEDKDDWPYEKIRYDEYDDVDDRYEFDYDLEIPNSCSGEHDILICDDDDPDDDVDTVQVSVYPYIEIDEDQGPEGTEVKVMGTGWDEDESEIEIRFYLEDPDDDYDDDDLYVVAGSSDIDMETDIDNLGKWQEEVSFTVPSASKGSHWVYAVGDENDDIADCEIMGVEFEVEPGISLEDTEGSPGDSATISGSGFEDEETDIQVLLDGERVVGGITADEYGCWRRTFTVPEAAKGNYEVTAEGYKTKEKDIDALEFEVTPRVALSPQTGDVGTTLTVSGKGFPANESVTVTYDGVSKGSGTTTGKGTLSDLSFAAEHSQTTHTTDHTVIVTYDATTVSFTFVMESEAPATPSLSSPANGVRLGMVSKVTPVFQWKAVEDVSGVSYDLQVGTSPDLAQVLISKTGLTETSYALSKMEGLSYGTYYWRVRAVDGAMNDSGWTTPYSFKSGLLPFWAFIASVAGLVVLVGALVFLLTRRGAPYD